MKFLKLDKKKGSGGPSIKSRYAYLILVDDIDVPNFPVTNEKGVRLQGDIILKEDCKMMPVYLTNSSQEFSYDIIGDDDEKSYKVKFSGTHPGTELEALEFAKNMIEQQYLILIPSCSESDPWKLLGEITNPLIFTSSHKSGKEGSKFTFNFEQRIGSEFIYFSYGGVEVPSGSEGVDPPSGGFDPTKWAKRNAENITDENVILWREALRIYEENKVLQIGSITATTSSITLGLHTSGFNTVRISGQILSRNVEQIFTFPTVTQEEIFQIYAINDVDVFHLALPGEEIPEGALFVRSITISENGVVVNNEDYKLTSSDNWRQYTIATNDSFTIDMGNSLAASFEIKVSGASAPTIGLIKQKAGKSFWDGSPFRVFNNSNKDIPFTTETYTDGLFKFLTFEPFVLKAGLWVEFVLKGGILKAVKNRPSDSNYQRNKQFFVSLPATVSEDWKGCIVFFTSSGNLTVPTGLTADFTFNGVVDNGVTLTPAITSPMAWLGTAPTAFSGVAIFTMVRRDGTNNFQILGV